jgi:hypothetical protein
MDGVAASACEAAFKRGKKQLVFARRVRSVSELKFKMETAYDDWLEQQIAHDSSVKYWWDYYRKTRRIEHSSETMRPEKQWTGRGRHQRLLFMVLSWTKQRTRTGWCQGPSPLPFNFRNTPFASGMFELNWSTLPGMPPAAEVDIDWSRSVPHNSEPATPKSRFEQAQYAYLTAVASGRYGPHTQAAAVQILKAAFPSLCRRTGSERSNITGSGARASAAPDTLPDAGRTARARARQHPCPLRRDCQRIGWRGAQDADPPAARGAGVPPGPPVYRPLLAASQPGAWTVLC